MAGALLFCSLAGCKNLIKAGLMTFCPCLDGYILIKYIFHCKGLAARASSRTTLFPAEIDTNRRAFCQMEVKPIKEHSDEIVR